ncbi:MAG: flagellar export protein FliJ [Gammaproteobacteria bacterium]|nr:flagellar export protein FliJ [Gammaproteobacteria bacterium]
MSKKKSQRIQIIKTLVEKQEESAVIELGKANSQLELMQNQLDKLYQYRDEYSQQFNRTGTNVKSNTLQDYIHFINNLNTGINHLLEQIEQQKKRCEQVRKVWLEKHQQVDIYQKVKDKFLTDEMIQQEKQEQKITDEISQAFFLRNK